MTLQIAPLRAAVHVKRLGESAVVAGVVGLFADPANDFVTGQVLYACGAAQALAA